MIRGFYIPKFALFSMKWMGEFFRGDKKLLKTCDVHHVFGFQRYSEFKTIELLKFSDQKIGPQVRKYLPYFDKPSELNRQFLMDVIF
jgi:hypothetical protein